MFGESSHWWGVRSGEETGEQGAIEQHGPHLRLIVNAAIGVGVLGKAMKKLDASIPAYALPNLYYGKSNWLG